MVYAGMAATLGSPVYKELALNLGDVRETSKKLGEGSYGEVVEVVYLGTACAAKRIHLVWEQLGGKPEEEFKRECQIWSRLRHPNVVQLLGLLYKPSSGSATNLPTIVMEKMDCSLRHFVETLPREAFPLAVRIDLLYQVAQGLAYLHGQRPPVVHRDLSPNNILINLGNLTVKLSDFGVARVFHSQASRGTRVPGTQHFMPPETFPQSVATERGYEDRIDVFSFGCIIICAVAHMWPEPLPPVQQTKEGKLVALTEVERRQMYLNRFDLLEKACFCDMVPLCLEFTSSKRPKSIALVKAMGRLRDAYPLKTYTGLLQDLRDKKQAEEQFQRTIGGLRAKETELQSELRAVYSQLSAVQAKNDCLLKELEEKEQLLQTECGAGFICCTVEEEDKFMNQECLVCANTFLMDEMVAMLHCQCSVCKSCFQRHYCMMTQEKNIKQFNCLICSQPDLVTTDIDKDDYLMLFAALLKEHVPSEHYQLFQRKAMEFALLKDPNFRWCVHTECGEGFIHDPPLNRVITCPYCRNKMCFHCKRPWEDQHKGISCNDFTRWKAENDEGNQQKGLAAFLKENGLECPKCHCRYDLARSGCLHFRCGQCPTDFCGGCSAVYDKSCRKYKSCTNKGFHAHHPRDCLFYLRDWPVERLQKMLRDKKIEFDTEAPEAQVNAARQADQEGGAVGGAAGKKKAKLGRAKGELVLKCRVMLQKEVGTGRVNVECGEECKQGHGGLCENHYKEYLIFKVNEALIDPADDMDVGELRVVIMREEKAIPEGDEKAAQYKEILKEQLKKDFPLDHRGGLNFWLDL